MLLFIFVWGSHIGPDILLKHPLRDLLEVASYYGEMSLYRCPHIQVIGIFHADVTNMQKPIAGLFWFRTGSLDATLE